MKIRLFIIAGLLLMNLSCRENTAEENHEHGTEAGEHSHEEEASHGHGENGEHLEEEQLEQEDFVIENDSLQKETETHVHEDGEEHEAHD